MTHIGWKGTKRRAVDSIGKGERAKKAAEDEAFANEAAKGQNYRNSPGGPYDRPERLQAVRRGRWKLHIARSTETCCALDTESLPPASSGESELPLLFDVQQDIGERRNLAGRQPEIVKELLAIVKEHQASFTPAPTQK